MVVMNVELVLTLDVVTVKIVALVALVLLTLNISLEENVAVVPPLNVVIVVNVEPVLWLMVVPELSNAVAEDVKLVIVPVDCDNLPVVDDEGDCMLFNGVTVGVPRERPAEDVVPTF